MKVLVLNGSPRGETSNTMQLTRAFLKGMEKADDCEIKTVAACQKKIAGCLGCYGCWTKTPGKCVIQDDMTEILTDYRKADVIIWSLPLYYYGMPSKIKALMDRLLPLNLPFMQVAEDGEDCGHPPRYQMPKKRYALISTCGFYKRENNYDALVRQFEILYGKDNLTKILCPEGELFRQPQLKARCGQYLKHVEQAGFEWLSGGQISAPTQKKLEELLYPKEAFVKMADASWDIAETQEDIGEGAESTGTSKQLQNGQPAEAGSPSPEALQHSQSPAARLMRQMAAVYNPAAYPRDVTLEFYFTDLKETYQLETKDKRCSAKLQKEDFKPYTTRIETPFRVWTDISMGKINGAQAMMEKKYKTLGDFDIMLNMDKMFGIAEEEEKEDTAQKRGKPKKTNMTILILLWCSLWIFLPIDPVVGAAAGLLAVAILPLAGQKWELTVYEGISAVCVTVISLLTMQDVISSLRYLRSFSAVPLLICLSYLLFGLIWTLSCLRPVPLTARYSMNDYGGEKAWDNPLFLKTNRILTLCWGILYLLTPVWTYFLMYSGISAYTGLINSLCPALLGIFTAWFQKWYPAKVARG